MSEHGLRLIAGGTDVPNADITAESAASALGVTIRPGALFPDLVASEVPAWLTEQLARGRPLAGGGARQRREFVVAPVLLAALDRCGAEVTLTAGDRLEGAVERGLDGDSDFLLTLAPSGSLFATIIVRADGTEAGLGVCAAQLGAIQSYNKRVGRMLPILFGCVTTGEAWQFLRLEGSTITVEQVQYHISAPGLILAAWERIVEEEKAILARARKADLTKRLQGAMNADLRAALEPVLVRLEEVAAADAGFRMQLRALGQALLALAEEPSRSEPSPPPLEHSVAPSSAVAAHTPEETPPRERLRLADLLHFGSGPAPAPEPVRDDRSARPTAFAPTAEDLPLVKTRCRLKSEAARWAADRHREASDSPLDADLHARLNDLIVRAKELPDCFLWMCMRERAGPADPVCYENLAGCYEVVAVSAAMLAEVHEHAASRSMLEQSLILAAEAQSALRGAVAAAGAAADGDQLRLYYWVRTVSHTESVWIQRYMRQDDPADPAAWPQISEKLLRLGEQLGQLRDRGKRRRKLLGKVRYHARRIQDESGPDHDFEHDWRTIVHAVDELVQEGMPPSNTDLRDLLLPVLDELPDTVEATKNFGLVLREIDRYLAGRPAEPRAGPSIEPGPDVRKVAELLRGRALVLIGGEKRAAAAEALTEVLGLSELLWAEGHVASYKTFEPMVARPEVAAVVLAIRWSSHGYGEVKEYCDKYGKPLVRLKGGYNPNQVAHHILAQVGDRLAAGPHAAASAPA